MQWNGSFGIVPQGRCHGIEKLDPGDWFGDTLGHFERATARHIVRAAGEVEHQYWNACDLLDLADLFDESEPVLVWHIAVEYHQAEGGGSPGRRPQFP